MSEIDSYDQCCGEITFFWFEQLYIGPSYIEPPSDIGLEMAYSQKE